MQHNLLSETLHALEKGLTSIPLSQAQTTTETWQQQLLQSGEPALQDVGRELGNLQSLLSSKPLDGGAIGRSLSLLGSQTLQAAAHAGPDQQTNLRALGDALLRVGTEVQR